MHALYEGDAAAVVLLLVGGVRSKTVENFIFSIVAAYPES